MSDAVVIETSGSGCHVTWLTFRRDVNNNEVPPRMIAMRMTGKKLLTILRSAGYQSH